MLYACCRFYSFANSPEDKRRTLFGGSHLNMLTPKRFLAYRKRLFIILFCTLIFCPCEIESCQAIECLGHIGMLWSQHSFTHLKCLFIERLGKRTLTLCNIDISQSIHYASYLRMFEP